MFPLPSPLMTVGAAVTGGVAVFGAIAYRSATQGLTTTPFHVNWTNEVYDLSGWHDNASNNERLTVPSGVSLIRLISNVEADPSDAIEHRKAGATFPGMGCDSERSTNIVSAPIAVSSGDYFTTLATLNQNTHEIEGNERSWMAAEILPAATKYALVTNSANQSITSGVNTTVTFDTEAVDTDAFHESVTNPSRLTVPSGVTLVRLAANAEAASATGQFILNINKNGATARGLPFKDGDSAAPPELVNLISAPIVVTAGDYFELIAFHTTTTTITAANSTWFSIEEVPSTIKRALVYKTGGTQSFTGGAAYAAVTWDAEEYDTNALHDTSTNNSRLIVPAGCTKARPCFSLKTSSVAGLMAAKVTKNGADYQGQPAYSCNTTGTDNLSAMGAWVDVSPGDYFEVAFTCDTTCTLGTENETWFCLECQ